MSERLARHGKLGAEEVTEAVETCFGGLLALAYAAGGSLLKFGGDALLILFTGERHAARAATSGIAMHERLRHIGKIDTSAGRVTLRMSAGVHSGTFGCFLVGESHRELILAGPDVSTVVEMEGTASAGQVVVSPATAAALEPRLVGPRLGPGYRLRRVAVLVEENPAPRVLDADHLPLADYVPAAIRRHVQSGGGEPEHRQVCIAFCHFDGTDELMRDEGPDAVAAALDDLVTIVQREVDRAGVTFLASDVDHDGGKLILASGVPASTGEDADNLLAAVRRIIDAGPRLPLRIGIHRGPVFAGEVGPAYRRTFTVMGDTVNLTARLMAKAAPGEIVASPEILQPARTVFDTTPLEPFMVKGKRRPVEASTLGTTQRREIAHRRGRCPLVGRDARARACSPTRSPTSRGGTGRAVELVGPAGIGQVAPHRGAPDPRGGPAASSRSPATRTRRRARTRRSGGCSTTCSASRRPPSGRTSPRRSPTRSAPTHRTSSRGSRSSVSRSTSTCRRRPRSRRSRPSSSPTRCARSPPASSTTRCRRRCWS